MAFSDEQLTAIIEEIRNDADYFSKTDSILNRCAFRHIDDTQFDDIAVDNLTERALRFSIVGKVVRKTTFLKPEGTFRPSGIYPTNRDELATFLSTRLKASLAPPRDVPNSRTLNDDWSQYQSTMAQLIDIAPALPKDGKAWSPYREDRNIFVLSHLLLSSKGDTSSTEKPKDDGKVSESNRNKTKDILNFLGEIGSDPIEEAEEHPDQQFVLEEQIDRLGKIRNWPSDSDWHKVADRYDYTHYINPLPAFDDEYELIIPQAYEDKLLGAVVHAHFTLSKFDIRGDRVFVCNIVELQVLKAPPGGSDIRKKRAFTELVLHKKKQRLV